MTGITGFYTNIQGRWLRTVLTTVLLIAVVLCSPELPAKEKKLPEVSHDGLHLVKQTRSRAVYVKPGASLEQYKRIALLDCYVAFAKDWQRDYNDDVIGINERVTPDDMKRIQKQLAAEFKKVFTEELETKGGYKIVDFGAEDVLILRPAIINLEINDPDTRAPNMNMTIVASAGEMTLYLELYDSLTNSIIARITDVEADREEGVGRISNSVTNKEAADRIMRRWADELRSHLNAAKAETSKSPDNG